MTPTQVSAEIDRLSRQALDDVLARIRRGETPREAIERALAAFRGPYYTLIAQALSETLKASIGVARVKAWPVGRVTLSQRLYAHHRAIGLATASTIAAHLQGPHSARALAKTLYEGYDFKPDTLKIVAALPKYLRVEFDRAQAARLKTPALRAAYLEAIRKAEAGAGMEELGKRLNVALQERNRYFANRIARTELHRAYTDQQARDLMGQERIQYLQIRLSSKHPRVDICDYHAGVDQYGLGPGVYPKAEAPLPPYHPHCLPGDALITASGRIAAVSKRRYDGDLAVITTASGQKLAATINHPILTPGGWMAIGAIKIGQQVICRIGGQGAMVGDHQHQNMPARIAEIADSFFRSGQVASRKVPLTAEDFHGDGMAGQIAVIGANRQLWDRFDAMRGEAIEHGALKIAHEFHPLFGDRVLDLGLKAFGGSAHRRMSGLCPFLAEFWAGLDVLESLGFAVAAGLNAGLSKSVANNPSTHLQFHGETQNRSTGRVFADDVIRVDVQSLHGDVYNLETEQGHYTGNNIITHNCYCLTAPMIALDPKANPRFNPKAERAFLAGLPPEQAARVAGGRERLQRALDGETLESLYNAGQDDLYKWKRVGDVVPAAGMAVADAAQRYAEQLESLPFADALEVAQRAVDDPLFQRFFEEGIAGNYPVGVLRPEDALAMGAESRTVFLSDRSLREHLEKHPEIDLSDYRKIPTLLDQGEVWQITGQPERLIYLRVDGVTYRAAIKRTRAGDENYFLTLFKNTKKKPPKGAVRVR